MTNPVLILTHNNLALTQRCVESVMAQDIPVDLLVIDNGSSDGTVEWLREQSNRIMSVIICHNAGVSYGWNLGLCIAFDNWNADYCLVIGNDTMLPRWFYRKLLSHKALFTTGIAVDQMSQIADPPSEISVSPNPDFSAFLIHAPAWKIIGPFDERMKHYCSDCDYHIRGHRAGVGMYKISLPYYHERSSTIRHAPSAERAEIEAQANADRATFRSIYGCIPGEKAYEEMSK